MKEIIKAVGIKHFTVYMILAIIETIVNIPFYIVKVLLYPFWYIYRKCFDNKIMFNLLKFKKIRDYGER